MSIQYKNHINLESSYIQDTGSFIMVSFYKFTKLHMSVVYFNNFKPNNFIIIFRVFRNFCPSWSIKWPQQILNPMSRTKKYLTRLSNQKMWNKSWLCSRITFSRQAILENIFDRLHFTMLS